MTGFAIPIILENLSGVKNGTAAICSLRAYNTLILLGQMSR